MTKVPENQAGQSSQEPGATLTFVESEFTRFDIEKQAAVFKVKRSDGRVGEASIPKDTMVRRFNEILSKKANFKPGDYLTGKNFIKAARCFQKLGLLDDQTSELLTAKITELRQKKEATQEQQRADQRDDIERISAALKKAAKKEELLTKEDLDNLIEELSDSDKKEHDFIKNNLCHFRAALLEYSDADDSVDDKRFLRRLQESVTASTSTKNAASMMREIKKIDNLNTIQLNKLDDPQKENLKQLSEFLLMNATHNARRKVLNRAGKPEKADEIKAIAEHFIEFSRKIQIIRSFDV